MSMRKTTSSSGLRKLGRPLAAAAMIATLAAAMFSGFAAPAGAVKKTVRTATKTTKKPTKKPKVPLPGSPCTERAANFPGTSLDCVAVPAKGLQWRVRGTVRNPFRPGEAVEVYSLESSRYRVMLTDWDSDVTEESRAKGVDPAVPGVAFLAYRMQSTLLASGGPKALNRASEATAPFAYVIGATVREDQSRSLSGSQPDLPAWRNGGIQHALPEPSGKGYLDTLQVGEWGWSLFPKETPADQTQNVVVEMNAFNAPGGPNAKTAVSYYFSGIAR